MRDLPKGGILQTTTVACLIGLYVVLTMGVTLLGSGVYQRVSTAGREHTTHRTALSYVANQLRQGAHGPVAVGEFEGCPALRMREAGQENSRYVTYIYCYDGQLRELYTELGSGLRPADGVALLALSGLTFSRTGALLRVTAGDEKGMTWEMTLFPRTGVEEVGRL